MTVRGERPDADRTLAVSALAEEVSADAAGTVRPTSEKAHAATMSVRFKMDSPP